MNAKSIFARYRVNINNAPNTKDSPLNTKKHISFWDLLSCYFFSPSQSSWGVLGLWGALAEGLLTYILES